MDRRKFLTRLGSAGAVVVSQSGPAAAGMACVEEHSAKNRCTAGVSSIPPVPIQPCRSLSWASCLRYILEGYGARIEEAAILDRYGVYETCDLNPISDAQRLMAAAGTWYDMLGRGFSVQTDRLPNFAGGYLPRAGAERIFKRLARQPLLSGAAGHTVLLTEVTFVDGPITEVQIQRAKVRDPWVKTRNLRPLTIAELAEPSYLIGLSIRPL